jgi:hypothetical protein
MAIDSEPFTIKGDQVKVIMSSRLHSKQRIARAATKGLEVTMERPEPQVAAPGLRR